MSIPEPPHLQKIQPQRRLLFSRKFIWLAIVPNNRSSVTVLELYAQTVQRIGAMPRITRCDGGTENSLVASVQYMAYGHDAHIYGSSTRNTRIEGAWRQMRDRSMEMWMQFFQGLVEGGIYHIDNNYHVSSAQFCFGRFITTDLELFKETWNRHTIRKDNKYRSMGGVPDVLYHHGSENYALPIPEGLLEHTLNEVVPQNVPYTFDFEAASNYLETLSLFPLHRGNMLQAFQALINSD